MKILVTGANGQVGFELVRSLSVFGDVLAPSRTELDLSDEQAVAQYLEDHQPQFIANAAAYTAVDKAEQEPELVDRLNHLLPKQFADYALHSRGSLIHFSSDYVYPGSGDTAYSEESKVGALSEYGRSKWAGDRAVMGSGCNHIILRTSWVYSARGNNFMKTMLRLAAEREQLSIVNDQVGAPTPARLLAQVASLSVRPLLEHELTGVYHVAPRGEASWHGFARAIFDGANAYGETLAVKQVDGIPTSAYPTPAKRPLNSRLNINKIERALKITLPSWQTCLEQTLTEYLDGL
ncbi:dTDP-4-dehydrorhamnose reductase [Idiomarina fontislapidosi]|uniref:dTDP-4-dehydrorhamnose reductase n=1 Tax=Idiomarina fontislapidosi TaxID=263723 RepID=A0A432XYE2_9GAMM|nr:dTDP-4-dehydrorhamnose reductase [Idiomarina fontislapidosi]PYE32843.1 dTDP-4-dehydrorhamnose reductase [Idiomarina fontislapidosi]RUO53717.1 dTDP-4-dehydrorhamnose reductase [Idiomarina fontislapidosi]